MMSSTDQTGYLAVEHYWSTYVKILRNMYVVAVSHSSLTTCLNLGMLTCSNMCTYGQWPPKLKCLHPK